MGNCVTGQELALVRGLLANVDCHITAVSQVGYQAVSGPGSQLAFALTAMLTIYVAIFGLRLLLGLAPLRVGELTVMALKLGLVLTVMTSWPTYQLLVYETLFRGPEQIAASVMTSLQPADSQLRSNPFDGLQIAYDQMQSAAAFFTRISPASISPFTGGAGFAALSLNLSALLALMTTLGLLLVSKIVLGLLLALGPIFIALLLFDNTRGLFEGWLRAALAFAFVPLFATLALTVQLSIVEPDLVALSDMVSSGNPNLAAANGVFILTLVSAGVSIAGIVGIFVIAMGFRLRWNSRSSSSKVFSVPAAVTAAGNGSTTSPSISPLQPRIAAVSAAAAALDRRDIRLESSEAPRRVSIGARAQADLAGPAHDSTPAFRRSSQPRRAASSLRRDR